LLYALLRHQKLRNVNSKIEYQNIVLPAKTETNESKSKSGVKHNQGSLRFETSDMIITYNQIGPATENRS
jgi:hypothetical protein